MTTPMIASPHDPRRVRVLRGQRTNLRTFIKSYHDLMGAIRDVVLPDPDVRAG